MLFRLNRLLPLASLSLGCCGCDAESPHDKRNQLLSTNSLCPKDFLSLLPQSTVCMVGDAEAIRAAK
jgi:hypothetical protein